MKNLVALSLLTMLVINACSPKTGEMIKQKSEASFAKKPIATSINLTAIDNDRLRIKLDPGNFSSDTVLFRLPRVVQGTYAVSNFGSFIDDFKAYAYDGTVLQADSTDMNTWMIPNATSLDRVEYLVNDTYDIEQTAKPTPFSPSGTNIDSSSFVLNLHGFVGYFEGHEDSGYEVAITSPVGMAYSSALPQLSSDTTGNNVTITYQASRYFDVTDNPMMYGDLTQTKFDVDGIEAVFSVYSPNGVHSASEYKDVLYNMMKAQKNYLGDLKTTDRYDIFLYLSTQQGDANGFGALEHQTSTVMVYPEAANSAMLESGLVDVVAHEFFHIVTPLSVHSEDVHYFDYNNPTFSKHLWMYEGLTEYFASHFQVYEGLQSRDDFYQKMNGKIQTASGLNDEMSFTEMSENVLNEPYASNYYNVYMKGALINMCMDIIMRQQSEGERSMLTLMKELSAEYGVDKPFDDDSIIEEITNMTYPEIGEFLQTHVVGTTPIDYSEFFDKVGLKLGEGSVNAYFFMASQQEPFVRINRETGEFYFREMELSSSLKSMAVKPGDVIKMVNGQELNMQTVQSIVVNSMAWTPDTEVSMVLVRDGEEIEVSGKVGNPTVMRPKLMEVKDATEAQIQLRNWWLGESKSDS